MPSPLEDHMSKLGLQLIDLVQRRERAEFERRYVEVLELEIAVEALQGALAAAADRLRNEA